MTELTGRRIAFLVANAGVEQAELTEPWRAIVAAGGQPVLLTPEPDPIQTVNHDTERGDVFQPDRLVSTAAPDEFAGLVLPGGVANPDKLRVVPEAVAFVRRMAEAGKPIAAICHGPWTLVEADVVRQKDLTSWPSLQTDIRNAGGEWHDAEVVTCDKQGFTLVTSRQPADLDAFNRATLDAFARP